MDKVAKYRQVFNSFRDLCSQGKQPCSFSVYCIEHGIDSAQMRSVLKNEFRNVKELPGYRSMIGKLAIGRQCSRIFEEFKGLCVAGHQPGTFAEYYKKHGITREQMRCFQKRNKLKVLEIPGYTWSTGIGIPRGQEIPFENVIFEESGFLPADTGNEITVKVDGHVAVSFPADTDVDVIARFVRRMGKEAGHVGS